jgi:hypothetical protein
MLRVRDAVVDFNELVTKQLCPPNGAPATKDEAGREKEGHDTFRPTLA